VSITVGAVADGAGRLPANVVPLHDAKSRTLRTIRDELAAGRTFPSQADLCRTIGVPRSTMSDWLGQWEAAGVIPARQTVGRCKRLAR
jgi:DNA-binding transcriptional MocR family regulator